jgi:glycosyltransferase involved in cell wall biosynthesis
VSATRPSRAQAPNDISVYVLARKRLLQNSRVFKQARSLARAGYRVTVVGLGVPGQAPSEQTEGFTIRRAPSAARRWPFPLSWLRFYIAAWRMLSQLPPAPAVIHCNDLDTLPIGVLLGRRWRAPIVYDAQDLYPDQDHIPRWLAPLLRAAERVLVRRVQRITVVNDEIGDVMRRRYQARIDAVILNCAPLNENTTALSLRDQLGIPQGETVVVYSGALAPHRGLEHSVLALKELDRTSLVLLGEGELQEKLERLAAHEGLGGRVVFAKFVPYAQVPAFIRSADIGIVPYEHYGLNHYLCSPSKLFHYIAAGLPIACSDFPFLSRVVIGEGIGATFDPSDPHSIAQAIRCLTAGETRDRANASLRSLGDRYSWEHEEQKLLAVYQALHAAATSQQPQPQQASS